MIYKIGISLLFAFLSFKALSQDSLKAKPAPLKNYAIVEIKREAGTDPEIAKIYYDNGKTEDVTNLFGKNNEGGVWYIPQKVLVIINYMAQKNYFLVSSTAISGSGDHPAFVTVYNYQYIFEKINK